MGTGIVSCDKDLNTDGDLNVITKASVVNTSAPQSTMEFITPVIITGDNRGGNRTCEEVASAVNTSFDVCGDKINYVLNTETGLYEWSGDFPDGITVEVDHSSKTIHFILNNLPGTCYEVGAVIVKGSNSSNIYFYRDGTLEDDGLAAPGGALVSNLTFCLYECDAEPLILAAKTLYWKGEIHSFALSYSTIDLHNKPGEWCDNLGVIYFPPTTVFDMLDWETREKIASAEIKDGNVIITAETDVLLDLTWLYVGDDINRIYNSGYCPAYTTWKYETSNVTVHTIPLLPYVQ